MYKSLILKYFILLLIPLIFPLQLFSQGGSYKVTGKIELGDEGRWDYLSVDESAQRLYVSNFSKVHIIDLKTNTRFGLIDDLHGVHGIAIVDEFDKGYISNGGNNTITVFDLKSLKEYDEINVTGEKPDAIVYDSFTKRVFAFNGKTKNATVIDAKTDKIVGTVKLDGSPEFAASDSKGKMWVNLEDEDAIQEFDPQTLKAMPKWQLAPCGKPTGLAYDDQNKRLFVGGRNKLMAIVDAVSGKVLTTLPIGSGVDACVYDAKDKLIFCSNGDGTLTVIQQVSADEYKVIDNVKTVKGAKTMAMDKTTGKIYCSAIIGDEKKVFGVIIIERK